MPTLLLVISHIVFDQQEAPTVEIAEFLALIALLEQPDVRFAWHYRIGVVELEFKTYRLVGQP